MVAAAASTVTHLTTKSWQPRILLLGWGRPEGACGYLVQDHISPGAVLKEIQSPKGHSRGGRVPCYDVLENCPLMQHLFPRLWGGGPTEGVWGE